MMCCSTGPSSAISGTGKESNLSSAGKSRPVAAVLFFLSVFAPAGCKNTVAADFYQDGYAGFYLQTGGIRQRETPVSPLCEQRITMNDGTPVFVVAYADEALKNPDPKNRKEQWENLLINLINDHGTVYCYDRESVSLFLRGGLSENELKNRLAVAGKKASAVDPETGNGEPQNLNVGAVSEFREFRYLQERFVREAKKIHEKFSDDPLQIDADFCRRNRVIRTAHFLTQPGVPYHMLKRDDYLILKKMGYPFLDFLVRDPGNRIFNTLPNCAQGATQIVTGRALYTKASQLAFDKMSCFRRLGDINQIQAGDLVLVVWNYKADAVTNSGHTGVVFDVELNCRGEVADAELIEFFPFNRSPRLVRVSRSMYGNWKKAGGSPGDDGADVFLLRLKKMNDTERTGSGVQASSVPEQLFTLLKQSRPEHKEYIVF
jgi:hypothetical protein